MTCRLTAQAMGTAKGGRSSATTKRIPVLQAACGEKHSVMLTEVEGTRGVRTCGDNEFGQLGLGHQHPRLPVSYTHLTLPTILLV